MTTTAGRDTPVLDPFEPEPNPAQRSGPKRHTTTLGALARYSIAGLMLGAAGIHFAMMGEHAGVSWTHGLFFASVAWLQIALAAVIILRPSRPAVLACIAINAATIGVWVLTRTVGIAIGGDGTPEAWGTVDIVCATFEGLAIVASALVLSKRFATRPISAEIGGAMAAFIGLVVVAVTTFVFSPAFASGGDGTSADGHNHDGTQNVSAGDGHSHAAPVDDKGLSLLHNGHHAAMKPEQPLSPADRIELTRQMNATIDVARRLPTPKDAIAAGWHKTGPYMPGIGAHFIKIGGPSLNASGLMSDEALATPLAIIYDGIEPDARIAGFMYYASTKDAPEGFAGPNDQWHFHTSLCIKNGPAGIDLPLGFDREIPQKQCTAIGGDLLQQSQWMVHVWSVPGWESAQGLFGEVNPALACPDGSYFQRPMKEWLDHQDNVCKSA
jgi:hypothetical protein